MYHCSCGKCKVEKTVDNVDSDSEINGSLDIVPPKSTPSKDLTVSGVSKVPVNFGNRLTESMKEIADHKVIKMITTNHPGVGIFYFGGGIRDDLVEIKKTDYDIVIVSDAKIRTHIFGKINRSYGGDLQMPRGYNGTMTIKNHTLVKFPGFDLVFVNMFSDIKFDYDVNTLFVKLKKEGSYDWKDVQTFLKPTSKEDILNNILLKKMTSQFTSQSTDIDNALHMVHRIIKMHVKGYRDVNPGALVEFFKLYCAYKEKPSTHVVTDTEIMKCKMIEDYCGYMFNLMRHSPNGTT